MSDDDDKFSSEDAAPLIRFFNFCDRLTGMTPTGNAPLWRTHSASLSVIAAEGRRAVSSGVGKDFESADAEIDKWVMRAMDLTENYVEKFPAAVKSEYLEILEDTDYESELADYD